MSKRVTVGSILKSKEAGQPPYIKFNEGFTVEKGDTMSLESKKSRLESLQKGIASGKLSEELAEKIEESINKMPDYVMFNIVKVIK